MSIHHSARRCVGRSASLRGSREPVGALSVALLRRCLWVPIVLGCAAREGIILASGSLAPLRAATLVSLRAGRSSPVPRAGESRLTPGGGQVMPLARRPPGVPWAALASISRRDPLPRRRWEPPHAPLRPRASPQAPLTPVHELPRPTELSLEPSLPSGRRGFASKPLGLGGGSRLTGVLVLQRAEFRDLVCTVRTTQS